MILQLVLLTFLSSSVFAADRQIAITFDDLPFAQSGKTNCDPDLMRNRTEKLLAPFVKRKAPVTGFVISNGCKEVSPEIRAEILKMWIKAGGTLENHTDTHPDFNKVTVDQYTAEIERTSAWMKKWLGIQEIAFFRSPYLHAGDTEEKKAGLERYLKAVRLRQGVVTIDNSDWLFANVYARSKDRGDEAMANRIAEEYPDYLNRMMDFFEKRTTEVIGRDIPHVLLLHANWLNADHIETVLRRLEARGYRFVSLADAMKDPAYQMKDGYVGKNGISWIHRWGVGKDMPMVMEPSEPEWLLEAYKKLQSEN